MKKKKVAKVCNGSYCDYRTPDGHCQYEGYCDYQCPRDSREKKQLEYKIKNSSKQ